MIYENDFSPSPLDGTYRRGPVVEPPQDRGIGDTLAASLSRGVDSAQAGAYAFAKTLGEATGLDLVTKWADKGIHANVQQIMENPPEIRSWDDVHGLADFGTYVLEALGEQAPQLALQFAGAAGGSLAAKAAIGKAMKRKLGEKAFANYQMQAALKGTAEAAQMAKTARRGALIGAGIAGATQNIGETKMTLDDAGVDDNAGQAILGGAIKGALDTLAFGHMLKLSDRLKLPVDAVPDFLTKQAAKVGLTGPGTKLAATIAKEGVGDAAYEGATEAAQTFVDQVILHANKPDSDLFSAENLAELRESAIKGGLLGGTFGAVETARVEFPEYRAAVRQAKDVASRAADSLAPPRAELPAPDIGNTYDAEPTTPPVEPPPQDLVMPGPGIAPPPAAEDDPLGHVDRVVAAAPRGTLREQIAARRAEILTAPAPRAQSIAYDERRTAERAQAEAAAQAEQRAVAEARQQQDFQIGLNTLPPAARQQVLDAIQNNDPQATQAVAHLQRVGRETRAREAAQAVADRTQALHQTEHYAEPMQQRVEIGVAEQGLGRNDSTHRGLHRMAGVDQSASLPAEVAETTNDLGQEGLVSRLDTRQVISQYPGGTADYGPSPQTASGLTADETLAIAPVLAENKAGMLRNTVEEHNLPQRTADIVDRNIIRAVDPQGNARELSLTDLTSAGMNALGAERVKQELSPAEFRVRALEHALGELYAQGWQAPEAFDERGRLRQELLPAIGNVKKGLGTPREDIRQVEQERRMRQSRYTAGEYLPELPEGAAESVRDELADIVDGHQYAAAEKLRAWAEQQEGRLADFMGTTLRRRGEAPNPILDTIEANLREGQSVEEALQSPEFSEWVAHAEQLKDTLLEADYNPSGLEESVRHEAMADDASTAQMTVMQDDSKQDATGDFKSSIDARHGDPAERDFLHTPKTPRRGQAEVALAKLERELFQLKNHAPPTTGGRESANQKFQSLREKADRIEHLRSTAIPEARAELAAAIKEDEFLAVRSNRPEAERFVPVAATPLAQEVAATEATKRAREEADKPRKVATKVRMGKMKVRGMTSGVTRADAEFVAGLLDHFRMHDVTDIRIVEDPTSTETSSGFHTSVPVRITQVDPATWEIVIPTTGVKKLGAAKRQARIAEAIGAQLFDQYLHTGGAKAGTEAAARNREYLERAYKKSTGQGTVDEGEFRKWFAHHTVGYVKQLIPATKYQEHDKRGIPTTSPQHDTRSQRERKVPGITDRPEGLADKIFRDLAARLHGVWATAAEQLRGYTSNRAVSAFLDRVVAGNAGSTWWDTRKVNAKAAESMATDKAVDRAVSVASLAQQLQEFPDYARRPTPAAQARLVEDILSGSLEDFTIYQAPTGQGYVAFLNPVSPIVRAYAIWEISDGTLDALRTIQRAGMSPAYIAAAQRLDTLLDREAPRTAKELVDILLRQKHLPPYLRAVAERMVGLGMLERVSVERSAGAEPRFNIPKLESLSGSLGTVYLPTNMVDFLAGVRHSHGVDFYAHADTGAAASAEIILHEVVHSLTSHVMRQDPALASIASGLQSDLSKWLADTNNRDSVSAHVLERLEYMLDSAAEIPAIALTDREVREVLERIPASSTGRILDAALTAGSDSVYARARKLMHRIAVKLFGTRRAAMEFVHALEEFEAYSYAAMAMYHAKYPGMRASSLTGGAPDRAVDPTRGKRQYGQAAESVPPRSGAGAFANILRGSMDPAAWAATRWAFSAGSQLRALWEPLGQLIEQQTNTLAANPVNGKESYHTAVRTHQAKFVGAVNHIMETHFKGLAPARISVLEAQAFKALTMRTPDAVWELIRTADDLTAESHLSAVKQARVTAAAQSVKSLSTRVRKLEAQLAKAARYAEAKTPPTDEDGNPINWKARAQRYRATLAATRDNLQQSKRDLIAARGVDPLEKFDTRALKFAADINRLQQDLHAYQKTAGVKVAYVDGYFHRNYNMEKIIKERDAFEAIVRKHGAGDAYDGMITNYLAQQVGQGVLGVPSKHKKSRKIFDQALINDLVDAGFLNANPAADLLKHIRAAVSRTEYERLAADIDREKGAFAAHLLKEVQAGRMTESGMNTAVGRMQDLLNRSLGLVPVDKTAWYYAPLNELRALTSLNSLLFGGLAGIPEGGAILMKTRGVVEAKQFAQIVADMFDGKSREEMVTFARDMGIIISDMQAALGSMMFENVESFDGPISKYIPKMLEWTRNEQMAQMWRVVAASVGKQYLFNLADTISQGKDADGNAMHQLRELSIHLTPEMIYRWRDAGCPSWVQISRDDSAKNRQLFTAAQQVNDALVRFMNETVVTPTAADAPPLATHPLAGFLFQLKGFDMTHKKRAVMGAWREIERQYDTGGLSYAAASAATWAVPSIMILLLLSAVQEELRQRIRSLGEDGMVDTYHGDIGLLAKTLTDRAGLTNIPFVGILADPTDPETVAFELGPTASKALQVSKDAEKGDLAGAVMHLTPVLSQLPGAREAVYKGLEASGVRQ